MNDSLPAVSLVTSLAFLFLVIWKTAFQRLLSARRLPYPPGPKPYFLIGNMLDFPLANAPKIYAEWGNRYQSSVVYINVLGKHVVILNGLEEARELLEKRSLIYSDRPVIPMIDLMGWGFSLPLMRYGEKWRVGRKIIQQSLRKEGMGPLEKIHVQKVNDMLRGFLSSPEEYESHGRTVPGAVTMKLMYGYDCSSTDDPFLALAEEGTSAGSRYLLPNAALINVLPALRYLPSWLPGAWFKKVGARIRKVTTEMQDLPMEYVKQKMAEGGAVPCVVSQFLENGGPDEMEQMVKEAAATTYGAASDTVAAAVSGFIYAMVLHPECQKEAQAEIDRVIGTDRLPNYQDRDSLPYAEAIYRELMRWRPPVPLSVPHATLEDDVYNGYFIPKGTIVIPNIWQMTHNPDKYSNPDVFSPERFFNEGKLNEDNEILAYGFGRRKCAGQHAASSLLWLIIVSVLAAFDVAKAKDGAGKEIEVDDVFTETAVSHKSPMQCSIKPRSAKGKKLVEETKNTEE